MVDWGALKRIFWNDAGEPMLFHSGIFLFIFSLFLIAYSYVSDRIKARNVLITVFSFYFYYMTSGMFLLLLIATISLDYLFSWLITKQEEKRKRKILLTCGILFSLSFLLYFKYRNFFLGNLNDHFGTHFTLIELLLPVGISFYTFQSISFLVDIYNRKMVLPKYGEYLMFMSFFPHLVAGPIVRAADFLPQAARKISVSKEDLNEAFYLISKGLIKKAIIGDFIAQYADVVFQTPSGFSGTENILAALCYTFQIFFDFSGYTDMAIGIALLLGFRLGVNFRSPYLSLNITDFWRRWHISLSSWLRDYIYIPLGGNAKGLRPQLIFLVITMLIGGFWHGADWKFVFWGGAHGMLLVFHKLSMKWIPGVTNEMLRRILRPLQWVFTFSCVALLWIPFRAASMSDAMAMYRGIFSGIDTQMIKAILFNDPLLITIFLVGAILCLLPTAIKTFIRTAYDRSHFAVKIVSMMIIIQTIIQMRTANIHPFIYFNF